MTAGIDFSDLIPPAPPPAEGQTGLPPGFQIDPAPPQPEAAVPNPTVLNVLRRALVEALGIPSAEAKIRSGHSAPAAQPVPSQPQPAPAEAQPPEPAPQPPPVPQQPAPTSQPPAVPAGAESFRVPAWDSEDEPDFTPLQEDTKAEEPTPEVPAEPVDDFVRQVQDLADPDHRRRAIYLSGADIDALGDDEEAAHRLAAEFKRLGITSEHFATDVDPDGGFLIADTPERTKRAMGLLSNGIQPLRLVRIMNGEPAVPVGQPGAPGASAQVRPPQAPSVRFPQIPATPPQAQDQGPAASAPPSGQGAAEGSPQQAAGGAAGTMFAFTPAFRARLPEAAAAVESELRRMLPSDVALRLVPFIRVPGFNATVAASYDDTDPWQRIVSVALADGPRAAKIKGFHEVAAHALRGGTQSLYRNLYTPQEWDILLARARQADAEAALNSPIPGLPAIEGYRRVYTRHAQRRGLTGEALTHRVGELLDQERVAGLAEQWAAGTDFGQEVNALLARILKFLEAIRNALRGLGFQTHDDVFQRVVSGEVAERVNRGAAADTARRPPRPEPQPTRAHEALPDVDAMDTFELRHLAKDMGLPDGLWRGRRAADIRDAIKRRDRRLRGRSAYAVRGPVPRGGPPPLPGIPLTATAPPARGTSGAGAAPPPIPPGGGPPPGGGGGGGPGGAGGPAGPAPRPQGFSLDRFYSDRMKAWATTLRNWWSPLERLPSVRDYRVGKYQALGRKANADDLARAVYDRFAGASEADKRAAYAYLTDAAGNPATIADPAVRDLAQQVKRLFNRIGQELVDRGMLSQEAVDHYRDQYLPRVYLRYLVGDHERLGGLVRGVNVARPSEQGYLKQRKDLDDETRALLGEVLDPGFLAARGMARTLRDLAIIDFLDQISANDDWVFRNGLVQFDGRRASPYYLMSEAESLDVRATFEPDAVNAALMRAEASAMRRAAQPALAAASGRVPGGYAQIPNSARYGMLRGMWVRKEIVNDLLPGFTILPEDASTLEKLFGQSGLVTAATRVWKAAKVPLNPSTQVRNVLSNAIMLNLSGMPPVRGVVRYMGKAVREIRSNGPMYRFAQSMGLKASGFSETELVKITREFLDYERTRWQGSRFAPVAVPAIAFKHLIQRGLASAGDLYQWFEGSMKLAKMMYEVEQNGMSREDAYLEAQKWLFDYSEVPRTVRYLRNAPMGMPFVSYQYFALPRILEVAATKPWRLAPYVAVPWAMAALFASLYGVDDDDVEKLRQALPEWMRKKSNAVVLPGKDESGRWRFFDFGYLLPWSSWQEAGGELAEGHPVKAAREMGVGGPIADLVAATLTNVDPFTQRPIADKRDPPEKQAQDVMSYVWRVVAPPWMTDQSFVRRIWEAWERTPSGYYGEPPLSVEQGALRALGLNVYPVDPERTRETNIYFMRRDIDDARRRMRSRLRDQRLSEEDRQRLQRSYQTDIERRQRDLEKYAAESEVHPNLKTPQAGSSDLIPPSPAAAPPAAPRPPVDFSDLIPTRP
ncbi:MAG TPA: hypothetical protein VGF29_05960 [Hyphomicrobiaceae bacterium]|jgi:hypothetical protein